MTIEQALDLVQQAVRQFRGTWEDHQHLQAALLVIRQAVAVNSQSEASNDDGIDDST